MFSLAFTKLKKIINYRESLLIDWNKFRLLSQILMNKGILVHPDNYERLTISTAHTQADDRTDNCDTSTKPLEN